MWRSMALAFSFVSSFAIADDRAFLLIDGVRIGTVASAHEICEMLKHPFFHHALSSYTEPNPNYRNEHPFSPNEHINSALTKEEKAYFLNPVQPQTRWREWDTKKLKYNWLLECAKASKVYVVDDDTLAAADTEFRGCLFEVSRNTPYVIPTLEKYFLRRDLIGFTAYDERRCYDLDATKTERTLSPDGKLIEREIKVDPHRCIFPIGGKLRIASEFDNFIFMLVLREAHPALKSLLDLAETKRRSP
jgi:hypothetical protein